MPEETNFQLRRRIVRQLNRAIRDLRNAREDVRTRRFETAEDDIARALIEEGRALRNISRLERRRRRNLI